MTSYSREVIRYRNGQPFDLNGESDDDGGNGFPLDDPEILPDGSPVEPHAEITCNCDAPFTRCSHGLEQ